MSRAIRTADLIRSGFEAVGCPIPVTVEDGAVIVRDLILEFDGTANCVRAETDGRPSQVFRYNADALEAAASSVVMDVLSGIVSRAVERRALEREALTTKD